MQQLYSCGLRITRYFYSTPSGLQRIDCQYAIDSLPLRGNEALDMELITTKWLNINNTEKETVYLP